MSSSGELHLELRAPPAEGQANEACVRFLARALRLPQHSVTIVAGERSRRKLLRITGRSAEEAEETVEQLKMLAREKRKENQKSTKGGDE